MLNDGMGGGLHRQGLARTVISWKSTTSASFSDVAKTISASAACRRSMPVNLSNQTLSAPT
jgi:hypothetical protein